MRLSRSRSCTVETTSPMPFGNPLGQFPAAGVDQHVRVLVGRDAQVAARTGGQHDVVAALGADEVGVGARRRAVAAYSCAEAKQMTRTSRCARGLRAHLSDEEGVQAFEVRSEGAQPFPGRRRNKSRSAVWRVVPAGGFARERGRQKCQNCARPRRLHATSLLRYEVGVSGLEWRLPAASPGPGTSSRRCP